MLKKIIIFLFITSSAFADMTVANCHVVDKNGSETLSLRTLYPGGSASVFRVRGDRFISLKFHFFTSRIAVTMLVIPHYPFTFFDYVLDRRELLMSGDPQKSGSISLEAIEEGIALVCNEMNVD